jgi:hypothetical protein
MLKVNGLSIEEVARATVSTIGAIKQDAIGRHMSAFGVRSGAHRQNSQYAPSGVVSNAALSRSSITALAHVANS